MGTFIQLWFIDCWRTSSTKCEKYTEMREEWKKGGQWLLTTTGKLKYGELGREEKQLPFVASTMGLFFFEIYIIGL